MGSVECYPVTAFGLCNALGRHTTEVVQSLEEGRSGLGRPSLELPFETVCGAVPGELPPPPDSLLRYDSRVLRMVLLAFEEDMRAAVAAAVDRWGSDRVAILMGTSTGGIGESERAYREVEARGRAHDDYDFEHQHHFAAAIDALALTAGITGPRYVISTACSSGGKALASGQRLLDLGVVDAVISGGVDGLCQTTLRGFHSLSILSEKACRPFGVVRRGINIGEGAAVLLIERQHEGATGGVNLLAVGESSDAFHMSSPDPEGTGAVAAMRAALDQAGLTVDAVDHINAHGTGTERNDVAEAKAVDALFGTSLPVCSTKGYTGHLLGAGGSTEAIFAALAIQRGWIPATLGAEPLDPDIHINVTHERQERRCRVVMSNSFGFGGSNVSVLLGEAAK